MKKKRFWLRKCYEKLCGVLVIPQNDVTTAVGCVDLQIIFCGQDGAQKVLMATQITVKVNVWNCTIHFDVVTLSKEQVPSF